MTYKIGTRVKKVCQPNAGWEAIIVGIGPFKAGRQANGDYTSEDNDVMIKYREPWTNIKGYPMPASRVSFTRYERITPIIPSGHRAGEEGRCEPLDKLLSEVRHEFV